MKIIGITGLIGSGKSTLANKINDYGYLVIDCDKLAKESLEIGREPWCLVIQHFGENIQSDDGSIDRNKLRTLILENINHLFLIESFIHPYIFATINKIIEMNKLEAKAIFIDAPLLYESKLNRLCNEVILITCADDERFERIKNRNNMDLALVKKLESRLIPITQKKKLASITIDNSQNFETTTGILKEYLQEIDLA